MLAIYEEAKSYYGPREAAFLPDLKSGQLIALKISNHFEDNRGDFPMYIHIIMKLPKDKLDEVQMRAYGSSLTRSFNDSNLLIIDYDAEKITHFRNLDPNEEPDFFPIPNFDFIQDNMFTSSYIDKATIYSFAYSRGTNMDKRFLRSDRAGLPEEWEHGMTKGVVIWDNYVAYWIDVW